MSVFVLQNTNSCRAGGALHHTSSIKFSSHLSHQLASFHLLLLLCSLPSIMAALSQLLLPPCTRLLLSPTHSNKETTKKKAADRVNTASLPLCVGRGKSNKPRGHFAGRQVLVSEAGERGVNKWRRTSSERRTQTQEQCVLSAC